jgi:hypothetical protein
MKNKEPTLTGSALKKALEKYHSELQVTPAADTQKPAQSRHKKHGSNKLQQQETKTMSNEQTQQQPAANGNQNPMGTGFTADPEYNALMRELQGIRTALTPVKTPAWETAATIGVVMVAGVIVVVAGELAVAAILAPAAITPKLKP